MAAEKQQDRGNEYGYEFRTVLKKYREVISPPTSAHEKNPRMTRGFFSVVICRLITTESLLNFY
jgi:hypothetical protein